MMHVASLGFGVPPLIYAYIDPGTGSYILQLLIAGALGALFAFKTYVRQGLSYISGLFARQKKDESPEQQ